MQQWYSIAELYSACLLCSRACDWLAEFIRHMDKVRKSLDQFLELRIVSALLLPMMASAILFTGLTIALLFAKAKIYRIPVYRPMLLNLGLAWIPIICVWIALGFFLTQTANGIGITILLLCIWFVFFPNSTYLVTEFHHLKDDKNNVPFWFDTIVILSLALCGLMLGSFSLLLVHRLLQNFLPSLWTWLIFIAYLYLSNVGIYIGRFIRFNSWDIVTKPVTMLKWGIEIFKDRTKLRTISLFASLYTVFLLAFYLFLYSAVDPVSRLLDVLVRQHLIK